MKAKNALRAHGIYIAGTCGAASYVITPKVIELYQLLPDPVHELIESEAPLEEKIICGAIVGGIILSSTALDAFISFTAVSGLYDSFACTHYSLHRKVKEKLTRNKEKKEEIQKGIERMLTWRDLN